MPRLCLIFMSVLLLAACTQVAEPLATTPAPTSSHSSLAQIDLETLVIQPGDLPQMEATVEKIAPPAFSVDSRQGIAVAFARLLKQDDYVLGGIYVDVYTDTAATKKVYDEESVARVSPS
jgi:hypothetical protein